MTNKVHTTKSSPRDEARSLGFTIVQHANEVAKLLEGGDDVKALFYTQIYILLRERVKELQEK